MRSLSGAEIATAVTDLARGLTYLFLITPSGSLAFRTASEPGPCANGGAATATCSDTGSGFVQVDVSENACRSEAYDGTLRFDGATTLSGTGLCPDLLVSNGLRFAFAAQATVGADDAVLLTADLDGGFTLRSFLFGPPPCNVNGGSLSGFDGPYRFRSTTEGEVLVEPEHASVDFAWSDFDTSCDPNTQTLALEGPLRVTVAADGGEAIVATELHGLAVRTSRQTNLALGARLSGEVDSDLLGGRVVFSTPTDLRVPIDGSPFTSGTLEIVSPRLHTRLTFSAEGVSVEDGGF